MKACSFKNIDKCPDRTPKGKCKLYVCRYMPERLEFDKRNAERKQFIEEMKKDQELTRIGSRKPVHAVGLTRRPMDECIKEQIGEQVEKETEG